MKYDLEDLKKISDELLPEAGPYMQRRIIDTCLNSKRKRSRFSRWAICAAAGFTMCALAVFCVALSGVDIFGFGMNDPANSVNIASVYETDAGKAAISPMTTSAGESITLVSASGTEEKDSLYSVESTGQVWFLERTQSGLYGIKDAYDKWVVEPEFANGYVVDDTIYLKNDDETKRFSIAGYEITE